MHRNNYEKKVKNPKDERKLKNTGGAVAKNPPANAGDTGSIPGLGRSHMPQNN